MAASDPAPSRRSLFEKFVSAIANVPKAEADAKQAERAAQPRIKPGPKPKNKPAA